MEVSVRYHLVSKSTISALSLNPQLPLLALTAFGSDTATFFTPSFDSTLVPRFVGESRPPSSACISWSPNGKLVAVAGVKVQIWRLDNMKLSPMCSFNEGMVEIKNVAWAPDSKSYLCNGIIPKQESISIKIRNVETKAVRQIVVPDMVFAANFDPFGKYIVVLLKTNTIVFYDAQTLDPLQEISMACNERDPPPFKDRRVIDWSPDYGYVLVPNLNEFKVPIAVLFDRHSKFSVHMVISGHTYPITCIKFNPNIFEYEGKLTFIVAIGDASGCISVWRITRGNKSQKDEPHLPLFISSSPPEAEECIDSLEWSQTSGQLYASTLKKYVVSMGFKLQQFGRSLSQQEVSNLILSMYGASGAGEITGTKLEIYGIDRRVSVESQAPQEVEATPSVLHFQEQQMVAEPKEVEVMVKTKQQCFINKATGKKRIVASRIVPESSLNSITQPKNIQNLQPVSLPTFRLPVLKQELKRHYAISQNLQLRYSVEGTLRSLVVYQAQSQASSKRTFSVELTDLKVLKNEIIVIYSQRLIVFNHSLDIISLPFLIGDISLWAANNQGSIFYLQTNGMIRGFNFKTKKFITETTLGYICAKDSAEPIEVLPISSMKVYDNDGQKVHIQLEQPGSRFFYCKDRQMWVQLNFEEGLFITGNSLRLTPLEKMSTERFFAQLSLSPATSLKSNPKFQQLLTPLELELVYYRYNEPNQQKYKEVLVKMFSEVKSMGRDEELRNLIHRFFIDEKSPEYQSDREVWKKVKAMGGRVIEQFVILSENSARSDM